jgi:hypothetical protein
MKAGVHAAHVPVSRSNGAFWSVLFGLFVVGWLLFFFLRPAALNQIGVPHFRIELEPGRVNELWFIDTYAILASNDALASGANPYASNRFDYMGRPHVYGPWWLYLHHLGLDREDSLGVGLALVAAFVTTAVLFLRPRTGGSFLWCIGVFCTTPILLGLERANNDLVVFLILTPLVPCLLSGNLVLRWISIPLIVLATGLKYYPFAASVMLMARAPALEIQRRLVVSGILFALVGWHVLGSVPGFVAIPAPGGVLAFGATAPFSELGINGIVPRLTVCALALTVFALWWRSSAFRYWTAGSLVQRDWMYFTLGSVLLSACFFAGQNYAYRWVFSIWLAPFLLTLLQDSDVPAGVRRLAWITATLLIFVLWLKTPLAFVIHRWPIEEVSQVSRWLSWVMQLFTWALMICLIGFIAKFARDGWTNIRASQKESPLA